MSNLYDEKTDTADDDIDENVDDETEYEKDNIKAFFGNEIHQFHSEMFDKFTQTNYYYLFKHYYVIEDSPSPPPEFTLLFV